MRIHRSSLRATSTLTFAGALALCAAAAHAQNAAAQPTQAEPATASPPPSLTPAAGWSVRIEPQVWYVGAEGNLTLPGSAPGTPSVKLSTLAADDPEASFSGQVTIRVPHQEQDTLSSGTFWKTGWFFSFGGASLSGGGDSTAPGAGLTIGTLTIAGGATVNTSVDWTTLHAEMGKWVTGSDFGSGGTSRIDLYAVAGARMHFQDISVTSAGDTTDTSETFAAALLGLRLDVKLPANFSAVIDANVNVWPGNPSCVGYEIAPTFVWQPTANVGVQIGYRLIVADTESGDEGGTDYYRLDGSLAGLFAGIEFRF